MGVQLLTKILQTSVLFPLETQLRERKQFYESNIRFFSQDRIRSPLNQTEVGTTRHQTKIKKAARNHGRPFLISLIDVSLCGESRLKTADQIQSGSRLEPFDLFGIVGMLQSYFFF